MYPRDVSTPANGAVCSAPEAQHLAVLDDIDPHGVGAARIAPGHGIVPGDAAAPLQRGADDGIADVRRDIERGAERLGLLRCQPLVVDAVQPVGIDVPLQALHIVRIVRQHQDPALREHDVVVELLGETFPQLQGVLVDGRALVLEVVGADDGGVASRIAAADPTLLQHGDGGQPVLLGEVVGSGKPMAPAADDHRIVSRFRFGRAPLALPSLVAGERLAQQCPQGEATHHASSSMVRRHKPFARSCWGKTGANARTEPKEGPTRCPSSTTS